MSSCSGVRGLFARGRGRINHMPYLLLTITVLTWSGHIVVAKGIYDQVLPVALTFWRSFIASIVLLIFAWPYLKNDWRTVRRSWPVLTLIAVPGVVCFNILMYIAVRTTSAINTSLITTTMPAMIIVLSWMILKSPISRNHIAGLFLSLLGAVMVITRGELEVLTKLVFVKGDLWMLAAVLSTALYSVFLHFSPRIHSMSLTAMIFIIGTVVLLPFYLWEFSFRPPVIYTPQVVSSILFIAIFPSVVAYFCWNRGIQLVGANRAGLFLYFVPFYVSVLAYLFLDEVLRWFHFAGLLLILAGVVLFNRNSVIKQ